MVQYHTKWLPLEGQHIVERVRLEWHEDFTAWRFRLRRGRGRYDGLAPEDQAESRRRR